MPFIGRRTCSVMASPIDQATLDVTLTNYPASARRNQNVRLP